MQILFVEVNGNLGLLHQVELLAGSGDLHNLICIQQFLRMPVAT